MIGGVAGGLADYLGIDPLLLRVAFAGLMVFGGAGLVLYVLAWLLIPAEGRDNSIGEAWVTPALTRLGPRGATIAVMAAAVLVIAWFFGQSQTCYVELDGDGSVHCVPNGFGWFNGVEPADVRAFALIAAVIVIGVLLFRRRGASSRSGPRIDPGPAADLTAAGTSVPGQMPWPARAVATPGAIRRRQPRSPLGWYIVAASLVAVGGLAVAGNAPGVNVAIAQYLGVGLLVVGIGLVIGTWWGRARLLILPGLLILPVAAAAAFVTVPLDGGIADQAFQPTAVGELRPDYRLAGGDLRLDLTRLPAGGGPIALRASVGVGRLIVVIPDDARLVLDARVNGGRLSILGNRQIGTGLADRVERLAGSGPRLTLTIEAGIGEVLVESAPGGG